MEQATFVTNDTELDPAEVRRETMHGSEYLVAPVVAVKEMVLNGGFLPYEEIEKSVVGWNGRPVTLHHPEDDAGNFVSANHPDVHDAHVYGRLFNAVADEDVRGLLAEMWLHAAVAQSLGGEAAQTVEMLEANEALEVSTGYFMEPVPEPGRHDGEGYEQFQTNLMPDHLATLPGGKGACSVEDGCGAPRVNLDAEGVAQKTVAGVTFSGTADGELNEADIPSDGFESHYLYAGDTKSDSTYPVVDADGQLRRGNVESAWSLGCRGQCPSDEEHQRRLMALGGQFDSEPDFVEENTGDKTMFQTVRHAGHVLTGQDCDCGGQPSRDMDEQISAVLADAVGVDFEDPNDPTEDELTALEEALADDDEPESQADDEQGEELTTDEVEALLEQREQARRQNDLIDRILDAQDADPEEDEGAWDRETLEAVNSEAALERILDDVTQADQPAGDVGWGGGVNYVGRGASEPDGGEKNEWDDYEVPTTVNFGEEAEEQEAD